MKLLIKNSLWILVFCSFGLFFGFAKKSSGGHPGTTGAPGDETCARFGCHVDAEVSTVHTANTFFINESPTELTYTPGVSHSIKIRVKDPLGKRFGYEIVALDTNNKSVGIFVLLGIDGRSQLLSANSRQYVTHTTKGITPTASGVNEWMVNWTASKSYGGPVTFYYATNATNGDLQNTGDHIYLSSSTVFPKALTVNLDESIHVTLFPNPLNGTTVKVNCSQLEGNVQVTMRDLAGKVIDLQTVSSVNDQLSITLSNSIPNGSYYLTCSDGKVSFTRQLTLSK